MKILELAEEITLVPPGEGGVLDIFLGEEVRPCPSYPDPV